MARKRSHASKKHKQNVDNIPMDSEDEFHEQNESIPLDDSTHLSDDDSDNEQEVYGLKGVDADDDDDDDDDIDIGDYEQVPDDAVDLPEQDDDEEEQESDAEEDPRKLKSWGSRQSAYYSRQDENQSEDDEDAEQTRKLEQEEALNLQKSSREQWSWDDVNAIDGVDDEEDAQQDQAIDVDEPESTHKHIDTTGLSRSEKIALLQKNSPETLALLTDYENILNKISETEEYIAKRKAEDAEHSELPLLYVYHQALLTYAPLITYFLCLRASPSYAHDKAKLLKHPIVGRLVMLRHGLTRLEDEGFSPGAQQAMPIDDEEAEEDIRNMVREWASSKKDDIDDSWQDESLEQGELEGLMAEEDGENENIPPPTKKKSKKSRKKDNSKQDMIHQLDESALEYKPSTSKSKSKSKADAHKKTDDDYLVEADTLSALDADSKKKNKKSLQFHTARIAKTDNRRSAASKLRQSGDDDVPYRERKKARLEKGGKSAQGDELDGGDWTAQDEAMRRQIMEEGGDGDAGDAGDGDGNDDGDDYYNLVRQSKKAKKQANKEAYDEARWKNRVDYVDESGVDGPRSLPRAIALNKAVTPARSFKHSKLNRNPRLKKRIRFDQAQKKLKSMKPVYAGGPQGGQYEGERSGISRNVKSTKL
ncbi:hypothetical protein E3P99_00591 [Wallemia hederae]|uniref:Sas10 C-terminal domain-containing protein n=1 Tax=Wallemia hederae TaxID=1540922 RepID=A0A4T0FVY9_9BASI|nr:hypothetical protein E3P99_00591 [Wallemia hederae]